MLYDADTSPLRIGIENELRSFKPKAPKLISVPQVWEPRSLYMMNNGTLAKVDGICMGPQVTTHNPTVTYFFKFGQIHAERGNAGAVPITLRGYSHVYKIRHQRIAQCNPRKPGCSIAPRWGVPTGLLREPLAGFGFPTIWKQLTHILTVEEGWIHDLQDKTFNAWGEEDCPAITELLAAKSRLRDATRVYIDSLSEAELNTKLAKRPQAWFGELRNPAFILLHVITHTFHHKGQVVAMLRVLGHPAPDTDLQRG